MTLPAHASTTAESGTVLPDRRHPDRQTLRPDGRRMLSLPEVAIHLNCSVETVRKLVRLGELRAVKLGVRTTRVPERSLCAFLDR